MNKNLAFNYMHVIFNVTFDVTKRGTGRDDAFIVTSRSVNLRRHVSVTKRDPVRDVRFIASSRLAVPKRDVERHVRRDKT